MGLGSDDLNDTIMPASTPQIDTVSISFECCTGMCGQTELNEEKQAKVYGQEVCFGTI